MSELNTEQVQRLQQGINENKKVTQINTLIDYSILILLTFLNEYWKYNQEDDQNDAWDFDCKPDSNPDKIIITIKNIKDKTPFQSIYNKLLKTVRAYIDFLRNNSLMTENVIDEIISKYTKKSIIIGNRVGPVINILNKANNDYSQKTNIFKTFKVENEYNTPNSRVPNFVKITFYKYPSNSEGKVTEDIIQYANELNQIRDDLSQKSNRELIKKEVKKS